MSWRPLETRDLLKAHGDGREKASFDAAARYFAGCEWRNTDMTTKLFSELGLSPELLKAIDKLGFEQAAPIQAEAIPQLMQGVDVVGQSQTGSGKTAAFG